jgi:hypothetical protein
MLPPQQSGTESRRRSLKECPTTQRGLTTEASIATSDWGFCLLRREAAVLIRLERQIGADDGVATIAPQATVANLKAQTDNLYKKHGYPSWEIEKKQRKDDERSRATRLPFSPSQAHGEVPSNRSRRLRSRGTKRFSEPTLCRNNECNTHAERARLVSHDAGSL